MIPASYEPLVAPARPRRQLWRTVLGAVLIFTLYILWMVAMGGVLWALQGSERFEVSLNRIARGIDPASLVLLLSTFLGGWVGVWLALRLLHRRRLGSLMGRAPVVLRDFATALVLMLVVGGALSLLTLPLMPPLQLRADLGVWFAYLPAALAGLLIQTGAEELVFRGYLQSQLAARFGRPLLYLTLPSILFGLAHYDADGLGANVWIAVAATGLFGLIAADLTQRTGSLGFAWGLHFANNVQAILVLSVAGGLGGMALIELPEGSASEALLRPLLIADMVIMSLVWVACRLWLRRR